LYNAPPQKQAAPVYQKGKRGTYAPKAYQPTIQLLGAIPEGLNKQQARIINRSNAAQIIRPIISDKEIRELQDLNHIPDKEVSDELLEKIEASPEFAQSKLPNIYTEEQVDYWQKTGKIPEGKLLTKLIKQYA